METAGGPTQGLSPRVGVGPLDFQTERRSMPRRKLNYYDRLLRKKTAVAGPSRPTGTSITFSTEELTALSDYVTAGLVMLRVASPNRAVSKIKAAMSRLKLAVPRGL